MPDDRDRAWFSMLDHEWPARNEAFKRLIDPINFDSKCEHWRSIDLADLERMGLLKSIVGGRIRAITWKSADGGLDKLGIIPSPGGIRFVKRDETGVPNA